jgi:hypothetical protein
MSSARYLWGEAEAEAEAGKKGEGEGKRGSEGQVQRQERRGREEERERGREGERERGREEERKKEEEDVPRDVKALVAFGNIVRHQVVHKGQIGPEVHVAPVREGEPSIPKWPVAKQDPDFPPHKEAEDVRRPYSEQAVHVERGQPGGEGGNRGHSGAPAPAPAPATRS